MDLTSSSRREEMCLTPAFTSWTPSMSHAPADMRWRDGWLTVCATGAASSGARTGTTAKCTTSRCKHTRARTTSSSGLVTTPSEVTVRANTTWCVYICSELGFEYLLQRSPQLDKHYEEHTKISAGDGIRGDLHAFTINDDDTAIYTGYQVVKHDLSEVGRSKESYIWESLFQELDIKTGNVLFEWRASEHFSFLDVYVKPNKAEKFDPWDFFHINMVEKDADGNYLVSTRYGRCVVYIDGKSGDILWTLGGKKNSFKDLSDGEATTFLGQHDAHWHDGHNYITMFDNRADWFQKIEEMSRGHKIKVDLEKMTAEIEQSYIHPAEILSTSQGSMQMLPNGHVLMGYGFNGVFTEFTADGEALCDAYMEPSKRFGSGDVQSYRDLKFNWTGIPLTTPDIALEGKTLYMSWLGSTKIRSWLLQDSDAADGLFESVQTTPKVGFETEFALHSGKRMRQYVRAIAVDEGGTQLSISNPVQIVDPDSIWTDEHHNGGGEGHGHGQHDDHHDKEMASMKEDIEDVQILLILGILVLISAVLVAWIAFGKKFMPFRTLGIRSEKMDWAFRDKESGAPATLRGAWESVRANIPFGQGKRGWRDLSGARRGLLGHERDDSSGDVEFDNSDFRIDDDEERQR